MNNDELKIHAINVRKNIVDMVYFAKSGHIGGSLSATDITTFLYFEKMNIDKENIKKIARDRFVLSKGHASPLLYAVLNEKGLLNEDLHTFRGINSRLQGHPSMRCLDGIDMSTGSLGQGVSAAVGMAIANKMDGNDHHIYCLMGDGECEEGLVWEAMMSAHYYELHNLTYILDYNGLQLDGTLKDTIGPEPFKEKFEAFGLKVFECDGHDFDSIRDAFLKCDQIKDTAQVVIAHTVKGKGVSFMENDTLWHGNAPNQKQYELAIRELGGQL